jgi:hypothetical protein
LGAELALKLADLPAQHRLRDVHALRGLTEVQTLRGTKERSSRRSSSISMGLPRPVCIGRS